jgi:hypothetical protein
MNQARIALLNEFKWKKVATIHQALEFFSVVNKKVELRVLNITLKHELILFKKI